MLQDWSGYKGCIGITLRASHPNGDPRGTAEAGSESRYVMKPAAGCLRLMHYFSETPLNKAYFIS